MKRLFPHFVAPVALVVLSVVAGCSSDNPSGSNTAGTSAGGAASAGRAGSTSSAGTLSAGGAGAGGTAAGGSAGAGTAGSSAGAGTAGSAAVPATFTSIKGLIAMKCASGAGCHTEPGNPLQMPSDDKLYATVTTHMTANCGQLVNKASPAQSAIVKLLQGDCGGTPRMPFQSCLDGEVWVSEDDACLSPTKIASIQAWIASGAPQN